jgi:hypothetical protein
MQKNKSASILCRQLARKGSMPYAFGLSSYLSKTAYYIIIYKEMLVKICIVSLRFCGDLFLINSLLKTKQQIWHCFCADLGLQCRYTGENKQGESKR